MSAFGGDVVTASLGAPPPPSDSQVPGIGRGAAKPSSIRSPSFLSGPGDLKDAIDQALLHGNGSITVPALNEEVKGTANLKMTRNRYERVKGTTNSITKGGLLSTYGKSVAGSGKPFGTFVFSSVYEGLVRSYQYAPQHDSTTGERNSIEFGDRVVTRSSWEVRTIHGAQANYTYGDVQSAFFGAAKEDLVLGGTKHDRNDQVMTVQEVAGLNLLLGLGLHLQCRPGAELNYNTWNVVIAISESLVGLVNLEAILNKLSGKPVKFGLSGARLSADGANIRFCGLPVGPMRIP